MPEPPLPLATEPTLLLVLQQLQELNQHMLQIEALLDKIVYWGSRSTWNEAKRLAGYTGSFPGLGWEES